MPGVYGSTSEWRTIRVSIIADQPVLGLVEDMEREDDARGPEPEPDGVFVRLAGTRRAVCGATGTERCPCGGLFEDCRGCPPPSGYAPWLIPAAQGMPDDGDDACPLCGHWACSGGCAADTVFFEIVRPLATESEEDLNRDLDRDYSDEELDELLGTATGSGSSGGAGQCSVCQQWFPGWNGGVCNVCRNIAR